LRRLDCGFDLHFAGMGLDGQQPGRGQGNNGVFQLHDNSLSSVPTLIEQNQLVGIFG